LDSLFGGYGQAAYGRSHYGSPAEGIEPRFNMSVPVDNAVDVDLHITVIFEVYYYTTSYPKVINHPYWGLVPDAKVEVSFDEGTTYTVLFDPNNRTQDLPGYKVRVRFKGGQTVWILVSKAAGWPADTVVKFRYTGKDEFGNEVSKTKPVHWS